jgi:hypothetical protein
MNLSGVLKIADDDVHQVRLTASQRFTRRLLSTDCESPSVDGEEDP